MRLAPVVFALALICSCGDSDSPAPSQAAPEPTSAETDPEESAEPTVERTRRPPVEAPDTEELRRRARADGVVLRGARLASREGRHAEAFGAVEALLERNPRGRRLHCEAGYLAHRAGRYERAVQLLDLGLLLHGAPADVSPAMRAPLAMCLYNRGRVFEDGQSAAHAAAMYRASLRLRPNATVEARLDGLGSVGIIEYTGPESAEPLGDRPTSEHGPDLASVQRDIAAAVCASTGDNGVDLMRERTGCDLEHVSVEVTGAGPRVRWVTFTPIGTPASDGDDDDHRLVEGMTVAYVAIVEDGGTDVIGPAAETDISSRYPAIASVESAEWVDIDGTPPRELVIRTRQEMSGSEDGCHDDNVSTRIFVARRAEGRWSGVLVHVGSTWVEECWGEEEGESDVSEHPSRFWNAELSFPGDGVLRFEAGEREASITLDAIFAHCVADHRHCSVQNVAAAAAAEPGATSN